MPKKDTKKKTAKPKVLKQKQKQKQTQNVTINIKNGTTKAPRKTATKAPPTQKLYPQVYPVFMNYDMPPPPFYNAPKIEQTEPVKIFVSPKIETEPIQIQTQVKVPDAIPITVKPKRKYTRRTPIIDNIPPMSIETTTAESSPFSPLKIPKTPPFSPPKTQQKIPFMTIDTDTPQNLPDRMIPYPKVKTPIIKIKRNTKNHLFPEDYERKKAPLPEGVQDMLNIGAVQYNSKKENSTTRADVAIRVSGKNKG
jgi:hypothetical protein